MRAQTEYDDLTFMQLQYKHASPEDRKAQLIHATEIINDLPTTTLSAAELAQRYKTMAYASELITYAENLRKIEHQAFFPIPGDYLKMATWLQEKADDHEYKELADYFEFKPFHMRLKKTEDQYNSRIWDLFQRAQVEFLASYGNVWASAITKPFDARDHRTQLYTLPQFFGEEYNRAVDRGYVTDDGSFLLAEAIPGQPQFAGGGMILPGTEPDPLKYQTQMLNEYLEEENRSLYQTAAGVFDAIEPLVFKSTLLEGLQHNQNMSKVMGESFKSALITQVSASEKKSSDILGDLIGAIDAKLDEIARESTPTPTAQAQIKALNELRASVQVETFAKSSLYSEALRFIEHHSETRVIDQANDVRRGGGYQDASLIIMKKPLEEFFNERGIAKSGLGDDMAGGKYCHYTMFQLLAHGNIRFSHLLNALTVQCVCLENNPAFYNNITQQSGFMEEYQAAKHAIGHRGAQAIQALEHDMALDVARQRRGDFREQIPTGPTLASDDTQTTLGKRK